MKMPEPTFHESGPTDYFGRRIEYTEEQMKQYGRDLLEEAAKKCDALYYNPNAGPATCAQAIRKLKETL